MSRHPSATLRVAVWGFFAAFLTFVCLPREFAHAYHFPWDQGHDTFDPDDDDDDEDEPPDEDEPCYAGNPVNCASGDNIEVFADILVPGLGPNLGLVRIYHSQDRVQGPFGLGWHTNLTVRAVAVSDGEVNTVIVRQANGRRKRFAQNADGSFQSARGTYQVLSTHADRTLSLSHKSREQEQFDSTGRLTALVDRNGNRVAIQYDDTGFITSATDASGRSLTFHKGANGKVSHVDDPAGRRYQYAYDDGGRLTAVTDPMGGETSYTYSGSGNLLTVVDPRGTTVVVNTYDSQDRVTRQTFPDGGVITYDYRDAETRVTNARGYVIIHRFNDAGNPTTTIDPLGRTELSTWDENYNSTSYRDRNGNSTNFVYDEMGNMVHRTDPLGNDIFLSYTTGSDQLTSVTDAAGNVTRFQYDGRGNLISVTDPTGHRTSRSYNSRGLVTSIDDGMNNTGRFEYDNAGNFTVVEDAMGNRTTFSYDLVGNLLTKQDAKGHVTTFAYDDLDRLTNVTDPSGNTTRILYDANGNVTKVTDAKGNATTYTYDSKNRLINETDPLGGATGYAYDKNDNLVRIDTADGQSISYDYNAADELVAKHLPGSIATYSYDNNGNLLRAADDDSVIQFTYDSLNRLRTASTSSSPSQPDVILSYQYDARGNRTSMAGPTGTVSYGYDSLGQLVNIDDSAGQAIQFNYNASGKRSSLVLPNGIIRAYEYDAAGQLVRLTSQIGNSANTLSSHAYTYDVVGNVVRIVQQRQSVALTPILDFAYDSLNRLVRATHPLASKPEELFSYDLVGNRLRNSGSTSDARFDAANRLLEDDTFTFAYSASGNRIQRTNKLTGTVTEYAYDAENHLVELREKTDVNAPPKTVAKYRYDALGRRIEKDVNGEIRRYTYDAEDIVLVHDGNDVLLASFLHGPGIDEPLVVSEGGKRSFFLSDALGSITELTDESGGYRQGYVYGAFGQIEWTMNAATTTESCYSFTGREIDVGSSLFFYRARFYDAAVGRFLERDPLRVKDASNVYSYAISNPISRADPMGMDACYIDFEGYPISTPVGTYPLGHAGALAYDPKTGATRYYEYGRYDSDFGQVKRRTVPDLEVGENGKITPESWKKLMDYLDKNVGKDKADKVTRQCYADSDYQKVIDYAEELMRNANRKPYSWFPGRKNTCKTFAEDAVNAGRKK